MSVWAELGEFGEITRVHVSTRPPFEDCIQLPSFVNTNGVRVWRYVGPRPGSERTWFNAKLWRPRFECYLNVSDTQILADGNDFALVYVTMRKLELEQWLALDEDGLVDVQIGVERFKLTPNVRDSIRVRSHEPAIINVMLRDPRLYTRRSTITIRAVDEKIPTAIQAANERMNG